MAAAPSSPPNPYTSMASMPGPLAPKKDDKTEELMKGFHGIFKLLSKMEEKNPGLSKDLAKAKDAMKNAVANVLKGDPTTLDADSGDAPPPPSNDNTPPPDGPAPPPQEAPPPAA